MSEMPQVLTDLATMINRMPASDVFRDNWRRMRLAVTQEEWDAIKAYYEHDSQTGTVFQAIRGVPLVIDAYPQEPQIFVSLIPRKA